MKDPTEIYSCECEVCGAHIADDLDADDFGRCFRCASDAAEVDLAWDRQYAEDNSEFDIPCLEPIRVEVVGVNLEAFS